MVSDVLDTPQQSFDPIVKGPKFTSDVINTLISSIMAFFAWLLFFSYYGLILSLELIGIVITFIVFMILLPYTLFQIGRWFEIFAYQLLTIRSGMQYLNYKTKCPFLKRKRLTFYCIAEQIRPKDAVFDDTFLKCHKASMWQECWSNRVPSILQVFDTKLPKQKQQLIFILANMKEKAAQSKTKMLEVLNNYEEDIESKLAAGYALAEMKEEKAILPLLTMLGKFDQRRDQTVRAILVRFQSSATPYLAEALVNCESENICGALIEVLGKIKDPSSVPVLKEVLSKPETSEYIRLEVLYALQENATNEAYEVLVHHLRNAGDEEHEVIRTITQSNKKMVLLLIELLSDSSISKEYYEKVGDILASLDASAYDKLFTQISQEEGSERARYLARILKENTPEDMEFQPLHLVLQKYVTTPESLDEF